MEAAVNVNVVSSHTGPMTVTPTRIAMNLVDNYLAPPWGVHFIHLEFLFFARR
jgi:hypothetical protein